MEPQTHEANTSTWLEANSDFRISAYVESCTSTIIMRQQLLPSEILYDMLRKISVPLPAERVVATERQLETELQAWDALSDEALMNFEQELG